LGRYIDENYTESMKELNKNSKIGVIGAGTMGGGIAQLAAMAGHDVVLFDTSSVAMKQAGERLHKSLDTLVEKGKITSTVASDVTAHIKNASSFDDFKDCDLVIEAIIEELAIKQEIFRTLESKCKADCILATNTSSLSVTSIAASVKATDRVIGIHFFNPAPIMPLVEIISGIGTSEQTLKACRVLIDSWKKTTVVAKDTPGFIVNRVARPFYGEAIRIYEEGIADFATIDWAMKEIGGFKMGPFELMDFIGNDVNYKVTETVWTQLFFDPRYKPSLTQKRLFEAGYWGKKKGRGYYNYAEGAAMPEPKKDKKLGEEIFIRVLAMLVNEAYDAWYYKIATKEDLELGMTKGVNYPKGLIQWAGEIGIDKILHKLEELQRIYAEERYRPSVLLKQAGKK
jgi:3-hydroxybutyryl-CoA dehydrogenase